MQYKLENGTNVRIPDIDIIRITNGLKVSKEEAIKIWLDDNGKTENVEQNQLDTKASKVKINHGAYTTDKTTKQPKPKTQSERVKKENPTKARLITDIAEMLSKYCENINIENAEKIITFSLDGKNFKIDLTQTRNKK